MHSTWRFVSLPEVSPSLHSPGAPQCRGAAGASGSPAGSGCSQGPPQPCWPWVWDFLECDCAFLTGYPIPGVPGGVPGEKILPGFHTGITWPCSVCWNCSLLVFVPFAMGMVRHTPARPCAHQGVWGQLGPGGRQLAAHRGTCHPSLSSPQEPLAAAPQITHSGCSALP